MKVINRKARFNYELSERVEAGVVLSGAEVKSAKQGKVSLNESFARVDDKGELWLHNAHIHPYQFADNRNYEPTRSRKLLLKKKEILSLAKKIEGKSLALVPTAMYVKKGRIKVEVAIGRGKKKWDKREAIKKREQRRELARTIRGKVV
ncbi:MAG: SsrA-binding protein [Candidatus Beckwithbacteria bacterium GW2011_GWB1_47_15]|uniref:SsrA-binding protein n=1 Tax=Candidatus Beckwithbacteria bacterium GW2011_GWB1_47_15 TaxID=1618371 RepID=A0A0G1RUB6_9BACT|nr:MAG: SsrA-binding protein, SsrA-binding protein [Candidatus Beckwithbacteria bacterium GW2011_GWC1_49_16]KKU34639.1 MAG: SsrA-binding protein [Candidatus Beckwithbacteria bacterium GW2011_GWA1_46_30]KKU60666.1 MAG: SsrA-binding protein [Candidatus Beckwithbacteria bacterium GW2011_GWB1_47_15]KKU71216.1 MAG: SsrA-binding protein [Candidatus Beckwithbacteria bacterium GW2011_GWA2_47_25]KKW03107.1 MAG: SsrA-binding protein [Candidatus Beckwithbacteria bacterium GW2011_GWC2_49_11]OGD48447.1 MAG